MEDRGDRKLSDWAESSEQRKASEVLQLNYFKML